MYVTNLNMCALICHHERKINLFSPFTYTQTGNRGIIKERTVFSSSHSLQIYHANELCIKSDTMMMMMGYVGIYKYRMSLYIAPHNVFV